MFSRKSEKEKVISFGRSENEIVRCSVYVV